MTIDTDNFIALYRELAELQPPEGSALDSVLEQYQTAYDAVAPAPHPAKEVTERDKAYHSIFVTALEGGIGYWSLCETYRWSLRDEAGKATDEYDVLGFKADIIDTGDGDGEDKYVIDRSVIAKGVGRYVHWTKSHGNEYHRRASQNLRNAEWDELDFDAEIADVIVQLGLFGELVYG